MRKYPASVIEHEPPTRTRLRRLLPWGVGVAAVGLAALFASAAPSAAIVPEWDGWRAAALDGATPFQDAAAVGREPDGALFACRALLNQDVHVGRTRVDFKGCHIGFDGREIEVKPFELLFLSWKSGDAGLAGALAAGTERVPSTETPFATETLFICRTSYGGAIHSGQARAGEKGCVFGFGGKRLVASSYELLQAAPWLGWVSATVRNLPDASVVSGMEGGEPFYACRAADRNGLHPGKVKRGFIGCSIVSEGHETTVDRFEVLTPRWIGGHAGTVPVGAYLAGYERGGGQFVCRAQNRDSVQVGKVSDTLNGCHVGMQGREVVIPDYEVLSQ